MHGKLLGRGKAKGHVSELQTQSRSVLKEITNVNCISPQKALPSRTVSCTCPFPHAEQRLRTLPFPTRFTHGVRMLLPSCGLRNRGLGVTPVTQGSCYLPGEQGLRRAGRRHHGKGNYLPQGPSRTSSPWKGTRSSAAHSTAFTRAQRSRVCFAPEPAELLADAPSKSDLCLGPLSFVCFGNDPLSLKHTQEEESPAGQRGDRGHSSAARTQGQGWPAEGSLARSPHGTGCAGTTPGGGGVNLPRWSGAI